MPDTITVTASRREELKADCADVFLSIKGTSFITGDAALKKAKEVNQLVTALTAGGVLSADIELRGLHTESSAGMLGRSTSAIYLLRVKCADLEKLTDVLEIITAQKNASLDQLVWRFSDDKEVRARWLDGCVSEAREKAQRIAGALGVKILGVHAFSEKWSSFEQHSTGPASISRHAFGAKAARDRNLDLGFSLMITKPVELVVEVQFRISTCA